MPAPLYAAVLGIETIRYFVQLPSEILEGIDLPAFLDMLSRDSSNAIIPSIGVERLRFSEFIGLSPPNLPPYIAWTFRGDLDRIQSAITESVRSGHAPLAMLREYHVRDQERKHATRLRRTHLQNRVRRVLFASAPSALSGAEQCLANTIQALSRTDFDLHCLISQDGLFCDRLRAAGASVHCPNRDFSGSEVENFLLLDELISVVKPDIIHCNAVVGRPLLTLSRLQGIPLAQWVRVADFDGLLDHLSCADMITPVSQFVARELESWPVVMEKVRVLYDCVDCDEKYSVRDVRQQMAIPQGTFVVVYIARFTTYKRHDILIRAIANLARSTQDIRLILVGERFPGTGDTLEETRLQIEQCGISDICTVLGFQEDIRSYEQAADTIVMCSEREPLGTVVLESMALGKPIVVSRSGGLVEMIEDQKSGLHCEAGDPLSLANCLRLLMENPGLRLALGENARKRALEEFSMGRHADRLRSLYDETMALAARRSELSRAKSLWPEKRPRSRMEHSDARQALGGITSSPL